MGKTTVKEVLVKAGKGKTKGKGKAKGGGAKKIGRSLLKCAKYKMAGVREKNKARKIKKDLKFKARKKAEKEKR